MTQNLVAPFDQELIEHTRPVAWRNPPAHGRYNLVVVGGGTAGLVCAAARRAWALGWPSSRKTASAATV